MNSINYKLLHLEKECIAYIKTEKEGRNTFYLLYDEFASTLEHSLEELCRLFREIKNG